MLTARTLGKAVRVVTVAMVFACSDDDTTGPNTNVVFPDWPSALVTGFCVRGTAVVNDTKSGSIASTDCDPDSDDPEGFYFETWRVRVASARDVTFDANSAFDNYLAVLRVNITTAAVDPIANNDDRSPGSNTNALVTVRLEPNVDYVVSISGYDRSETGPYTLAIR